MNILKYITLADFLTVLNALVGFLAIMYVIDGLFVNAFILILFAIILDGLDGFFARMMKLPSRSWKRSLSKPRSCRSP